MLAVLAILLAAVPLLGGSLLRLSDVRLRRPWTLPVALLAQILVVNVVPHADRTLLVTLHLASYGLAAVFLRANRRVPGLWLLALGAGLNLLAIGVNGGVMPARPAALEAAGISHEEDGPFVNSGVVDEPRLGWLGDIFAVPAPLPLHNVFSVGDVLIVAGAGCSAHRLGGSRPGRRLGRLRPSGPGHLVGAVPLEDDEGAAMGRPVGPARV